MTWYAAHIIVADRPIARGDKPIAVWENVVLVEADGPKEACTKARKYGESEADPEVNEGLKIDGQPAESIFVGIRKVVSVSNPFPLDQDKDRPVEGTEVTYMRFNVNDEQALQELVSGNEVDITYLE